MRAPKMLIVDNLKAAGAPHDDETVWKTLRRFHILVFDFTATDSASAELITNACCAYKHQDIENLVVERKVVGGNEIDARGLLKFPMFLAQRGGSVQSSCSVRFPAQ
jgi:hypothetical protein